MSPCTLANPCTVPVDGVAERLVHVDGDRVADAHGEVDEEAVLLLGDLLQGGHELRREAEAPVRGGARHSRHVAVPVRRLECVRFSKYWQGAKKNCINIMDPTG